MEHFITKIKIEKVRHLENIEICLSENERRHLFITGNVDEVIVFRKVGYFGVTESLAFEIVDNTAENVAVEMTRDLLQRVYYGKTPQENVGAKMLRHEMVILSLRLSNAG